MNEYRDAAGSARRSIGATRHPGARRAILTAARELLSEGGAEFSIEAVARRSGAGKPTIYRWWKGKAQLLAEVIEEEKDAVLTTPDTGALVGDLVAYTRDLFRFWRDNPVGAATRGLIAEAQTSAPALETLREEFLPRRLALVRPMFTRAALRSEIAAEAVENVLELWVAFAWFRLLTGRLDADPALEPMLSRIAASAVR